MTFVLIILYTKTFKIICGCNKLKSKIYSIFFILLFLNSSFLVFGSINIKEDNPALSIKVNIEPYSVIYEGDIINCTITGHITNKYWLINNESLHTSFYNDNPVIFDPEPTPLNTNYVNLTVYIENKYSNASETVPIILKRIYFGDVHFHSTLSDGKFPLDTIYKNALKDNYLDFACSTEHAELWLSDFKYLYPFAWFRIKNLVEKYNIDGKFSTLLAYEYTGSKRKFKNFQFPLTGDTSHINFYYKDIYKDAKRYPEGIKTTYSKIFNSMSKQSNKGNYNIGFFHHPLAGNLSYSFFDKINYKMDFYVNFSNFVDNLRKEQFRNNVLNVFRGVEVFSRWGSSIGKYSGIPICWPYNNNYIVDDPNCWVENGLWKWSESNYTKGQFFGFLASSDSHHFDRPGSGGILPREEAHSSPSGIICVYSVHNKRNEIWDAMNNCSMYGTQLLKIRANLRVDGQMALGNWINCSSPAKIKISAMSTFNGNDNSGKNMCPNGYLPEELDYPIEDIWLIKKDTEAGKPWCKVISHWQPKEDFIVVEYDDYYVQPNDFYYVAIRQKGQELRTDENEFMSFIGPIFVNKVD